MEALLIITTKIMHEGKEIALNTVYKGEMVDKEEFVLDGLEAITTRALDNLVITAIADTVLITDDNDKVIGGYKMSNLYKDIEPWNTLIAEINLPVEYVRYCCATKVWPITKLENINKELDSMLKEEKLGKDCAEAMADNNKKGLRAFVADMPNHTLEQNLEGLKLRMKMLNAMKNKKYQSLVDQLNGFTEEKKAKLGDKGFKKVVAVILGFFVKTAQLIIGIAVFSFDFIMILVGFAGNMVKHTVDEVIRAGARTSDAFSNDILYLFK